MRANKKSTKRNIPFYSKLKASIGQSQVLLAILFLFLVPTSVILAQNATLNETLPLEGNLISDPALQETIEMPFDVLDNIALPDNTTNHTNQTQPPTDSLVPENTTNQSVNETFNGTNVPPGNITINNTNTTIPEINITENTSMNETNTTQNVTINDTNTTLPDTNITVNDTNYTVPEPNIAIPIEYPSLFLGIDAPERFVRGTTAAITAKAVNRGLASAYNTVLVLEIPEYFEIASGDLEFDCGDLGPSENCENTVRVDIPADAVLSKEEIKVTVSYAN